MNKNEYKREFPRTEVKCPVLYARSERKGKQVAILVDLSATGLRMMCKEYLPAQEKISIEVKPGSNRVIPPITGIAEVVYSESVGDKQFSVSCKLIQVNAPGKS